MIEIAQKAGVRRSVVTDWRTRHADFPSPVATLAVGPVFWWPDVLSWLAATGRKFNENRTDLWADNTIARKKTMLRAAATASKAANTGPADPAPPQG